MCSILIPLKEVAKDILSQDPMANHIHRAIYRHFMSSHEPLTIDTLTEKMKLKHLIPLEKTMNIIKQLALLVEKNNHKIVDKAKYLKID